VDVITGIGWQVVYTPNTVFGYDIEVYVSFTGKLVGTNPVDLQERFHERVTSETRVRETAQAFE
jgi:hypothetical protein